MEQKFVGKCFRCVLSYRSHLTIPVGRSSRVVFFRAEVSEKHTFLCIFFNILHQVKRANMGHLKLTLKPGVQDEGPYLCFLIVSCYKAKYTILWSLKIKQSLPQHPLWMQYLNCVKNMAVNFCCVELLPGPWKLRKFCAPLSEKSFTAIILSLLLQRNVFCAQRNMLHMFGQSLFYISKELKIPV